MMADPLRHRESCIIEAMEPLESFGLLDADRADEFESAWMTPQEKLQHRETAVRHIAQVAFTEINWLRARNDGPVDAGQRARLDRLVKAIDRIQDDVAPRACLFIRAEQARFAGDQQAYTALARQAEQAEWEDNDTEIYLEAIRLFTHGRYPEARQLLTKLADRGSVESVGVVTDVGLFLSLLVKQLTKFTEAEHAGVTG